MSNPDRELCDGVDKEKIYDCVSDIYEELGDFPYKDLCPATAKDIQTIAECGEELCGTTCTETNEFFFNSTNITTSLQSINGCEEDLCTVELSIGSNVLAYSLTATGIVLVAFFLTGTACYLKKRKVHVTPTDEGNEVKQKTESNL